MVGLNADVALIPLVRVGVYGDFEYAYTGEPKSPTVLSFGARIKVGPPTPFHDTHFYGFVGVGYAELFAPGYLLPISGSNTASGNPAFAAFARTTGGFVELPFGVGAAWRFRRPYELVVELSGRIGLASSGGYFYERPGERPRLR
jgi:hypothetical protein